MKEWNWCCGGVLETLVDCHQETALDSRWSGDGYPVVAHLVLCLICGGFILAVSVTVAVVVFLNIIIITTLVSFIQPFFCRRVLTGIVHHTACIHSGSIAKFRESQ